MMHLSYNLHLGHDERLWMAGLRSGEEIILKYREEYFEVGRSSALTQNLMLWGSPGEVGRAKQKRGSSRLIKIPSSELDQEFFPKRKGFAATCFKSKWKM